MKKTTLTLSLFLCIAFANAQENKMSAPATNVPATAVDKNAPDLKFDIETYDFGTIKQGDKVTHDFDFVNTGKEPLVISQATGSCGCTVPQWPKEPVTKGSKSTIHVEFNSTGKMGMQDKTVTITSNSKSGQKILHLKGNVEAPTTTPETQPVDKK